ncbi:hypothetical protein [Salisediminibacterium beveridgei]|nr:hypothetical protein [Salisediminibacterium beveridgei]
MEKRLTRIACSGILWPLYQRRRKRRVETNEPPLTGREELPVRGGFEMNCIDCHLISDRLKVIDEHISWRDEQGPGFDEQRPSFDEQTGTSDEQSLTFDEQKPTSPSSDAKKQP